MAVAFDAKATTVTSQTVYSSPVTNAALTVGGSGSIVIGVFAGTDATTCPVPTAMTWNSVAMTPVSNKAATDGFSNIYVYAIVSPTTGSHTLSCTYTNGTGAAPTVDLDCFSFSGTDTTSVAVCIPSGNVLTDASTNGGTNYPSAAFTVTTASGDTMVAVANSRASLPSGATVGTALNDENVNHNNYGALYHLATTASTQGQFGQTFSGSPMCGVAFRIIQPGAAVAKTPYDPWHQAAPILAT